MQIRFSLVDDKHEVVSTLDDEELRAIGAITVAWAILEHFLWAATEQLYRIAQLPLPPEARSLSFKKRRRAFSAVIDLFQEGPATEELRAIAQVLGEAESQRHMITHGLWDYRRKNADKLDAISLRPGLEFQIPFDIEKLLKLEGKIANASYRLGFPGPDGKTRAIEAAWGEGTVALVASRSAHRRPPASSPRRTQPKPPKEG